MAVTILLSARDLHQGKMIAEGSVADAQNTGESINIDFTNLTEGTFFVERMTINSASAPSTIPDLDPEIYCRAQLSHPELGTLEQAFARVLPFSGDTDADGAPERWAVEFDYPFTILLENRRWTIDLNVPPADANASAIGIYSAFLTLQHVREG